MAMDDFHRFSLIFPLKCHFIFTRYSPDATGESSPLWFTVVTFGWWWSWLNPHDALRIPQRIRGSHTGCRQGTSTASVSNHLLHSCCSWKATWRHVNQMETSYRVQPTRPYQNKFKNFQALSTMLVFGVCLFLLTAATSVLQKQPWRSVWVKTGVRIH